MIPKPLADIRDADLLELRDNQVAESKQIEYKRDLPGASDSDKREFLKDVSAFANTMGGDLFFGIDAVGGVPQDFPGIGNVDEDGLRLRLESLCRDGLDPRLPKIDFHVVTVAGNRVLVIRIPQSWTAPHRVKLAGHGHFYARGGAGTFQMDVPELRTAFISSETIAEKIRNFRMDRLARINADDTPTPINIGCRLVLHLAPLSAFARSSQIDISQAHRRLLNALPFAASGQQPSRINLDGVLNYTNTTNGRSRAYTQVYRDGVIESVAVFSPEPDGIKQMDCRRVQGYLHNSLPRYLRVLEAEQIAPPVFIFLSIVGTTDLQFIVPDVDWTSTDRDSIVLPEFVITDYGASPNTMLKPVLDMLWNAFGYAESRSCD